MAFPSDAGTYLGIELGDLSTTAVVVDANARVRGRACHASSGIRPADVVREAMLAAGVGGSAPVLAGIAAMRPDSSASAALAGELKELLHPTPKALHSPAAAALAEAWCGAAAGCRNLVTLGMADTITCGVILDGRVWPGAHGLAGSAGWLSLNPVDREDYRRLGCLEAEVNASGIVRRMIWRIKAGDTSHVLELAGGNLSAITLDHVLSAARSGDGVAMSVVRDTTKYLGMAVSNLVAMLDPEAVILGGLFVSADDLFVELLRQECGRRLPPALLAGVRLEPAILGADGPALGAARHAMTHPT